MPRPTKTGRTMLSVNETALLGLLAEKPRYGYDLDKVIQERGMREWTEIAFSSVYAALRTLEEKEFVISRAEVAENRLRKHYSVTKIGKKALRESVARLLAAPVRTTDDFMVGVANIKTLNEAEAAAKLEERKEALAMQFKHIDDKKKGNVKSPFYITALFEHTEMRLHSEIDFIDALLSKMKAKKEPIETIKVSEAQETAAVEPIPKPEKPKPQKSEGKETLF